MALLCGRGLNVSDGWLLCGRGLNVSDRWHCCEVEGFV